jgi:hypothetical protein
MAVWWVFQNKSYQRSRDGGYLWAPLVDKEGHRKSHWDSMDLVSPGDVVLSSVNRHIVATSVAKTTAFLAPQPDPQDAEFWGGEGRMVRVAYVDLPKPLPVDSFQDLFPLLQVSGGPLNKDGGGKQGYLFEVPPTAALRLLDRISVSGGLDDLLSEAIESDDAGPVTVTDRLQKVRVGQQRFREGLLDLWGAQCALTGIRDQRLLIASHIKPWRLSNDCERVDPHNGILLEARFDKLFDSGLISFDQQGHMMVSSLIDSSDRVSLGLSDTMALRKNLAPLIPYLTFHRQHVFLT